jgi:3-hydroxyacyl-CoA dehydrogenase
MTYKVNHAVVIGAGTMGAALAAHLANAGVLVTLLDIVPQALTPKEEARKCAIALSTKVCSAPSNQDRLASLPRI